MASETAEEEWGICLENLPFPTNKSIMPIPPQRKFNVKKMDLQGKGISIRQKYNKVS